MHLLLTSYYRECLVFETKEGGASRSGEGRTSHGYSLRIHEEIQDHHCCLLVQGSGHPDVRVEGEGSELSQFCCSAGDEVVGGKEGGNRKPMRARVE